GARAAKRALLGRQDDEFHSGRRDVAERLMVGGALRQPYPLGPAFETRDEILDPPRDLQRAVARAQQRQDRMGVGLRDRVAGPAALRHALLVAEADRAVGVRAVA